MNAVDFISEGEYKCLCKLFSEEKDVRYSRQVNEEKNRYKLDIHNYFDLKGEYQAAMWIDYRYAHEKGKDYGDVQGGGTIAFVLNDWQTFKNKLNERLKSFPDYSDAEQMKLF